jgi:DNA polymerase
MAYTGRRIDAAKAKEIGLVNDIYDTHEELVAGVLATAREIAYCLPYLRAQVEILGPKVILAFGNVPLNALAGGGEPLRVTQVRGTWREAMGIPMMPTFHPSYLLHNPAPKVKRDFWEDLLAVMERLGLPVSERQRGYFR